MTRASLLRPVAGAGLLLAALLAAAPARAAGPEGLWFTEDRTGVIEIRPCETGLCGRIVGLGRPVRPDGSIPADLHGTPLCGLTFLHIDRDGPDRWSGLITDPETGRNWDCIVGLDADGNLTLRGYVLIPPLGQTQIWPKFTGQLATDCAFRPA